MLGVTGGQAAYLFKPHHSLSDGIGLLQLLDLAHGHSRQPGPADDRPMPKPRRKETPEGLLVNRLAAKVVSVPAGAVREAISAAGRFAGDPVGTTTSAIKFAMSLQRVLTPPDAPHSPALTGSGSGYRLDTFDVAFDELKAAGKAAGGSVNDAFIAALLGGVRRYHEKLSLSVDFIPVAIPVSLRTDSDPMGANKFAGARFVAPVGEPDPKTRIAAIQRLRRGSAPRARARLPRPHRAGAEPPARDCSYAYRWRDDGPIRPASVKPRGDRPSALSGGGQGDARISDGSQTRHTGDGGDVDLRRNLLHRRQLRPRDHYRRRGVLELPP